jgi:hypothetical protein
MFVRLFRVRTPGRKRDKRRALYPQDFSSLDSLIHDTPANSEEHQKQLDDKQKKKHGVSRSNAQYKTPYPPWRNFLFVIPSVGYIPKNPPSFVYLIFSD